MDAVNKFVEKRVKEIAVFDWGSLWQTCRTLYLHVNLEPGTRAKHVQCDVKVKHITLVIAGKTIFQGELDRPVIPQETLWTIEGQTLALELENAHPASFSRNYWKSLLADGTFPIDGYQLYKMRLDLELEEMQSQRPELDFSSSARIKKDRSDDPQDMIYEMLYQKEQLGN